MQHDKDITDYTETAAGHAYRNNSGTINFREEFSNFAGYSFDKITSHLNSLYELPMRSTY